MDYATLGDQGREVVFTIDANHTDMVQFWGKQDPKYEVVVGELSNFVLHEIAQVKGE